MQFKTSLLFAICASASLVLTACSSSSSKSSASVNTIHNSVAPSPIEGTARIQGEHGQGQADPSVYRKRGMEISAITSRMADGLQRSMFYYLLPDAPTDPSSVNANVKIVTMPRIAITSFVDTDTFENAGYLGRALAEFFTNEMSNRAFEVTEYKLTGKLAVTRDGDFILSRNWKKIAKDTRVKYLLGGTITRNDRGVVLVARIVNMQTRQVIAAATDFIPYELIPSCYRTPTPNCKFDGQDGYLGVEQIREARYYKEKLAQAEARLEALKQPDSVTRERSATQKALTRAQVRSSSGQPLGGVFITDENAPYPTGTLVSTYVPSNNQAAPANAAVETSSSVGVGANTNGAVGVGASASASPSLFSSSPNYVRRDPRFTNNTVQGATSRGNYDDYRASIDGTNGNFVGDCSFGGCNDPVVYPSNTYMHNTMIVRDSADESSYDRTK